MASENEEAPGASRGLFVRLCLQAADIHNVSRPYLVKLVDEGAIPSRKVGVQRRLLLEDVVAYKRGMFTKQLRGMAELAELSRESGLDDVPPK